MKILRKLSEFLRDPPPMFLIPFYIVAVASVVGAVLFAVSDLSATVGVYIVYALAAVCLAYAVYTLVLNVPRVKRFMRKKADSYELTRELTSDYDYRTAAFAAMSFVIDLVYVAVNAGTAIYFSSLWYACVACYYFALAVMRGVTVLVARRIRKRNRPTADRSRVRLYGVCGCMLIVLDLALAAAVTQFIVAPRPLPYMDLMLYATAAYAFIKLTLAIKNILRSRKRENYVTRSLRNIGLTDACVSVFALQISLTTVYDGGSSDMLALNAASGFTVCALTVVLGVYMIVVSLIRMYGKERVACRKPSGQDADDAEESAAENAEESADEHTGEVSEESSDERR